MKSLRLSPRKRGGQVHPRRLITGLITGLITALLLLAACLPGAAALAAVPGGDDAPAGPRQQAPDQADLTVNSMTLSTTSPSKGDTITIDVSISNKGTVRAGTIYLDLIVDNISRVSRIIGSMEAGETKISQFTWVADYGTHTIGAVIDIDNYVDELDETNNTASASFTTVVADLVIDSILWSPAEPLQGEVVTYTVTVKNQGAGASTACNVNMTINGVLQPSGFIGPLAAGANTTANFSEEVKAGGHDLSVIVDPYDTVVEGSETNNQKIVSMPPTLPDLLATGITWLPALPSVNEKVTFSITVKNQGRARSAATEVYYYLDLKSGTITLPALDVGSSTVLTFDWTSTAGPHPVQVDVDPNSKVDELDENNNRTTVNYSGTRSPDLVIESITWDPPYPELGKELTISVVVFNKGQGDAEDSELAFYINDELYKSVHIGILRWGEKHTQAFTWTTEKGIFTFKALADYKQSIPELDENNNEKERKFAYPAPPDLSIDSLNFTPEYPANGDNMTFNLTARNQETNASPEFTVGFYIDDQYIGYLSFGPLAANSTTQSAEGFIWKAVTGNHALLAKIDPSDQIFESDENNNERALAFSVAEFAFNVTPGGEVTENQTGQVDANPAAPKPATRPAVALPAVKDNRNSWTIYIYGLAGVSVIGLLLYDFLRRKGGGTGLPK